MPCTTRTPARLGAHPDNSSGAVLQRYHNNYGYAVLKRDLGCPMAFNSGERAQQRAGSQMELSVAERHLGGEPAAKQSDSRRNVDKTNKLGTASRLGACHLLRQQPKGRHVQCWLPKGTWGSSPARQHPAPTPLLCCLPRRLHPHPQPASRHRWLCRRALLTSPSCRPACPPHTSWAVLPGGAPRQTA